MVGLHGVLRVLGINDIDIEAPLRGILLFIRNLDVPGSSGAWARFSATARSTSPISPWDAARKRSKPSAWSMSIITSLMPYSEEIRAIPAVRMARVVEV